MFCTVADAGIAALTNIKAKLELNSTDAGFGKIMVEPSLSDIPAEFLQYIGTVTKDTWFWQFSLGESTCFQLNSCKMYLTNPTT